MITIVAMCCTDVTLKTVISGEEHNLKISANFLQVCTEGNMLHVFKTWGIEEST